MIRNLTWIKILALAAALFTACTQDELAEQGNTLPDGEYPLQIGSVSITGSTVYKYTYNAATGSSSSDGSVTY